MQIHALTTGRYADAVDLFRSNPSTRGCWCQHPLLTVKETGDGWGDGNQIRFRDLADRDDPPGGLLAYDDSGKTIGWCATGPRSRYTRALRSPLMTQRDPDEDDAVWLVPCFFVRSGHRRTGVTHQLLLAAIDHSRRHGATAIEGFPLSGPGPHTFNRYLGTEPLFTDCGFTVLHRPSTGRAIMRLTHLGSPGSPAGQYGQRVDEPDHPTDGGQQDQAHHCRGHQGEEATRESQR